MDLEFHKKEDKIIVDLIGELDHHNAEEVRVKIDDRIDRDNIKKLILNFKSVTFMDSSALGALVLAFKTLRDTGTKLVLCSINEQVRILFELTGMDNVFEIFPSQDEFREVVFSKN